MAKRSSPRSQPVAADAAARERRALGPGDVARLAGVHVETLRYYESIGLLPPPARTRAGRRVYDDETITLLQSIRLARSLGLRIDDILSVHGAIRDGASARETLVASLEGIVERTRCEIAQLAERQRKLEAILTRVRAAPPGDDQKVKEHVRSAWRRVESTRRAATKRVS